VARREALRGLIGMAERITETPPPLPDGEAPAGGRKWGTLKQAKTDEMLPLNAATQERDE
jgi:hypothetical protein